MSQWVIYVDMNTATMTSQKCSIWMQFLSLFPEYIKSWLTLKQMEGSSPWRTFSLVQPTQTKSPPPPPGLHCFFFLLIMFMVGRFSYLCLFPLVNTTKVRQNVTLQTSPNMGLTIKLSSHSKKYQATQVIIVLLVGYSFQSWQLKIVQNSNWWYNWIKVLKKAK